MQKMLDNLDLSIIRQNCPECGFKMDVIDCRRENETTFVWYSCKRDGCKGQWLKTISAISPSSLKKVC